MPTMGMGVVMGGNSLLFEVLKANSIDELQLLDGDYIVLAWIELPAVDRVPLAGHVGVGDGNSKNDSYEQ